MLFSFSLSFRVSYSFFAHLRARVHASTGRSLGSTAMKHFCGERKKNLNVVFTLFVHTVGFTVH